MHDVRQLRVPWPDYEISAPAAPFPADAIPPPLSYPDPVYVRIPDRGTALVSDAIDRFLVQRGVASELASEPYRLPGPLQASAPYVLVACNAGRMVFNGDVVGMRGDPLPPLPEKGAPLRLHRARFFDAQCSNDLCTLRITHRGTGGELDPRRALLTGADGHLRTLAGSVLADAAGVSTLAVTADGAARPGQAVAARRGQPRAAGPVGQRFAGSARSGSRPDRDPPGHPCAAACSGNCARRPASARARSGAPSSWASRAEWNGAPNLSSAGLTVLSQTAGRTWPGHLPRACGDRLYSGGTLTLRIDLDVLGRELAEGAELLTAPGPAPADPGGGGAAAAARRARGRPAGEPEPQQGIMPRGEPRAG